MLAGAKYSETEQPTKPVEAGFRLLSDRGAVPRTSISTADNHLPCFVSTQITLIPLLINFSLCYTSRMKSLILFLAIALLLSACNMFAPPASQQTLQAERDTRATEVAIARETATPQADRLALTMEAAQTSVSRAAAQTTRIAATLLALGTPFVDIRFITPQPLSTNDPINPDISIGSDSNVQPIIPVQPTIIGQGGAQGNTALDTTPDTIPATEVTPDLNTPNLVNLTVTDTVGADDCAVGNVTAFTPAASGVYIVAQANNLTPNNRLVARWLREDVEQIFYEWSPGFNIASGCIWFNMPTSDVDFAAGNWSVQLELDGQPVGASLPFTVSDGATTDVMTEGSG